MLTPIALALTLIALGLLSRTEVASTQAHFHVWRLQGTNSGRPARIDPHGWVSAHGADPWAQASRRCAERPALEGRRGAGAALSAALR